MVLCLLPLILGYGENPLPEMTSLAEAHGIRLFSLPTVGREVDAFSFMFDGVPYIAVEVVPEKLRTLDRGRPWRDSQFASTRLSPSRDMSR